MALHLFTLESHVLFILIGAAWLAMLVLVVALCQLAARSDLAPSAPTRAVQSPLEPLRLIVWERQAARPLGLRVQRRPPLADSARVRSRRLAHGVR
jgi:hypothetical protein